MSLFKGSLKSACSTIEVLYLLIKSLHAIEGTKKDNLVQTIEASLNELLELLPSKVATVAPAEKEPEEES